MKTKHVGVLEPIPADIGEEAWYRKWMLIITIWSLNAILKDNALVFYISKPILYNVFTLPLAKEFHMLYKISNTFV